MYYDQTFSIDITYLFYPLIRSVKSQSKVGAKTNYFWYFMSSYTIRIKFFNNFFH